MKNILFTVIIFISSFSAGYAQCIKANVSIAGPSSIFICEGDTLTLSSSAIAAGASQNGGFTYAWKKSTTPIIQQTEITLPANTSIAIPDFTINSTAIADAGTYILRVEDGNAGNPACYTEASVVVTVNPKPSIYGTLHVCEGLKTQLTGSGTAATSGGWVSKRTNVATIVNNTGLISGVSWGTSIIIYTNSNGCEQTATVTVNQIPTISGNLNVCTGSTTQLTGSGTPHATVAWVSGTPAVATVSNTGAVTGVASGTSVITYTNSNGCTQKATVTVNSFPFITGTFYVCLGSTTQLTGSGTPAATDTWTSASPTIATVDNTGLVTGLASGTSVITYTNSYGCISTTTLTVANTTLTPSVSITASPGSTICNGTSVSFKANGFLGGTPTYEWTSSVNGEIIATGDTYTSSNLVDGEVISVKMNSTLSCALPTFATKTITMHVLSNSIQPSVSLTADKTVICNGDLITFTATPANSATAPLYEWFINNISQGVQTTSSVFTTTALTSSDLVKVILTSSSGCASPSTASASTSVNVNAGIGAGTIGIATSTICYNSIPSTITEITAAENITGTATYVWEVSLTGSAPFTPIAGSSGPTYTPEVAITQDVYIRRITIDASIPAPCNTATSNLVHIIVLPQLVAGSIASDEILCPGSNATTITEISAPTGGTGSYTYQWEYAAQSGGPYVNILNATNTTYAPSILSNNMYFRRIETSGTCGSVMSNEVLKAVSSVGATIQISDPGQICQGDIFVLKCQATNMGLAPIYNWYVNDNIIYSNTPAFTPTILIEPLKSGDEMYVELLSDNTCTTSAGSIVSNVVTVDLIPCTVSNSPYTVNNVPILMQNYVSNSVTSVTDYTYFWSITSPFVITGPSTIIPGQQNIVYSVPVQAGLTYTWTVTGGNIVSGQNTNSVMVDWDEIVSSPTAQTTSLAYSISVTKANQANQSKTINLDITSTTTGVTQTQAQSGINVFPNPTTGSFSIAMPQSGMNVTYEILDVTGLSVASGTFTSTGSDQKIDANFGAGMYQIILKYDNVVTCARLSKVQ